MTRKRASLSKLYQGIAFKGRPQVMKEDERGEKHLK